jgi:hypothetical protein
MSFVIGIDSSSTLGGPLLEFRRIGTRRGSARQGNWDGPLTSGGYCAPAKKKSTRCVGGHASGQLHDIVPRRQRVEEPLICHLATLPTTLHKNKGKGDSRRVARSCLVATIALERGGVVELNGVVL